MRSRLNLLMSILTTALPKLCVAAVIASATYHYEISAPNGWVQIPAGEIARFKAALPPQAANIVYDAGVQPAGHNWLTYPYVLVQIVPPQRTHLSQLPTEAQFESIASNLTSGRTVSKVTEVANSIQDSGARQQLGSFASSLSRATIQIDSAQRKYSFVTDMVDPSTGPITAWMIGRFTADGSVIQLNCYSAASEFNGNVGYFASVADSLRSFASAPSVTVNDASQPSQSAKALDTDSIISDALAGALIAFGFYCIAKWKGGV